jgi:hypothetical protein
MKKPNVQKGKCKKRKYDVNETTTLIDQGISDTNIAKIQGVSISAINRFRHEIERKNKDLLWLDKNETKALKALKFKTSGIINDLLDTYDEVTIKAMATAQKSNLIGRLSTLMGIVIDKLNDKQVLNVSNNSFSVLIQSIHQPEAIKAIDIRPNKDDK